jgi:hypothetical protein
MCVVWLHAIDVMMIPQLLCTYCTVFNKSGSTAINCPRSLQILYCQKMLFCTLQRIYSSVAIFSDYLIKKSLQFWRGLGCSMQTNNFQLCKSICGDCKILIAKFKLQDSPQKTAAVLGSDNYSATTTKFTLDFNCTGNHYVEKRPLGTVHRYIFLF